MVNLKLYIIRIQATIHQNCQFPSQFVHFCPFQNMKLRPSPHKPWKNTLRFPWNTCDHASCPLTLPCIYHNEIQTCSPCLFWQKWMIGTDLYFCMWSVPSRTDAEAHHWPFRGILLSSSWNLDAASQKVSCHCTWGSLQSRFSNMNFWPTVVSAWSDPHYWESTVMFRKCSIPQNQLLILENMNLCRLEPFLSSCWTLISYWYYTVLLIVWMTENTPLPSYSNLCSPYFRFMLYSDHISHPHCLIPRTADVSSPFTNDENT